MTVVLVSHDAGGTIPPMLALAEEFAHQGRDVVWVSQPSVERRALAAGARFVPFDGVPDYEPRRSIEEQLEIVGPLIAGPELGRQVLAVAKDHDATLVVVDANLAAVLAAVEASARPSAVVLHSLYATFTVTWFADIWPLLAPIVNDVRAQFGLDACDSWGALFDGHDRVLSVVPEAFDTHASQWPPTMRHFGFLIPARSDGTSAATYPEGDGPAVLVGLSTTYQHQERQLQDILDALGDLDVRAVASTAGQVDAASLRCPGNVVLREFLDHAALLPVTDVVVTHAGLGTVASALRAGVPMVCTPIDRDQPLNASRVAALGAGIDLGSQPTAGQIADAVQAVLADPSYRDAAKQVTQLSAEAGEASAAVSDLLSLHGTSGG